MKRAQSIAVADAARAERVRRVLEDPQRFQRLGGLELRMLERLRTRFDAGRGLSSREVREAETLLSLYEEPVEDRYDEGLQPLVVKLLRQTPPRLLERSERFLIASLLQDVDTRGLLTRKQLRLGQDLVERARRREGFERAVKDIKEPIHIAPAPFLTCLGMLDELTWGTPAQWYAMIRLASAVPPQHAGPLDAAVLNFVRTQSILSRRLELIDRHMARQLAVAEYQLVRLVRLASRSRPEEAFSILGAALQRESGLQLLRFGGQRAAISCLAAHKDHLAVGPILERLSGRHLTVQAIDHEEVLEHRLRRQIERITGLAKAPTREVPLPLPASPAVASSSPAGAGAGRFAIRVLPQRILPDQALELRRKVVLAIRALVQRGEFPIGPWAYANYPELFGDATHRDVFGDWGRALSAAGVPVLYRRQLAAYATMTDRAGVDAAVRRLPSVRPDEVIERYPMVLRWALDLYRSWPRCLVANQRRLVPIPLVPVSEVFQEVLAALPPQAEENRDLVIHGLRALEASRVAQEGGDPWTALRLAVDAQDVLVTTRRLHFDKPLQPEREALVVAEKAVPRKGRAYSTRPRELATGAVEAATARLPELTRPCVLAHLRGARRPTLEELARGEQSVLDQITQEIVARSAALEPAGAEIRRLLESVAELLLDPAPELALRAPRQGYPAGPLEEILEGREGNALAQAKSLAAAEDNLNALRQLGIIRRLLRAALADAPATSVSSARQLLLNELDTDVNAAIYDLLIPCVHQFKRSFDTGTRAKMRYSFAERREQRQEQLQRFLAVHPEFAEEDPDRISSVW